MEHRTVKERYRCSVCRGMYRLGELSVTHSGTGEATTNYHICNLCAGRRKAERDTEKLREWMAERRMTPGERSLAGDESVQRMYRRGDALEPYDVDLDDHVVEPGVTHYGDPGIHEWSAMTPAQRRAAIEALSDTQIGELIETMERRGK